MKCARTTTTPPWAAFDKNLERTTELLAKAMERLNRDAKCLQLLTPLLTCESPEPNEPDCHQLSFSCPSTLTGMSMAQEIWILTPNILEAHPTVGTSAFITVTHGAGTFSCVRIGDIIDYNYTIDSLAAYLVQKR